MHVGDGPVGGWGEVACENEQHHQQGGALEKGFGCLGQVFGQCGLSSQVEVMIGYG